MVSSSGSESRRALAGFLTLFAAIYGAYGALSPFLPAFLRDRGLSPQEIAAFLAAGTLTRLVAGPLFGRLADASGRTTIILVCGLGLAAVSNLALSFGRGFWLLLPTGLLQALATAPVSPLADALALAAARNGRAFQYGWVRAAGSLAFIVATILTGFLVGARGNAAAIWISGAAFAAAAAGTIWARRRARSVSRPDGLVCGRASGEETGPGREPAGFAALAANGRFRAVVLAAALVIGAHAMHDAFAVIIWREAGMSAEVAGLLWAESVAAEVLVFLWLGPMLIARLGASRVLALAGLAGALRWAVQGTTVWLPAMVAIQSLHGLTFAALHLACLALIEDTVPARQRATALTVYSAFGLGLASALITLVSGHLFARAGVTAFWAMSALSMAAVPVALSLNGGRRSGAARGDRRA